MRACYSAGALVPLWELGLIDCFDHIIGSSAGAINGAYFLGADKDSANIYLNDLTNKNFVDLLRRDKKIDVDYAIDMVVTHKRPISINRLKAARPKLHVVVTNANSGRRGVISDHSDLELLYEELRATAALPILYNKKVRINDRYYIDGGVADLIPLDVAHELGCTDIVVLMTQQVSSYRFDAHHTRLVKHLVRYFARKQPESIRRILPTNEHILKLNLRHLKHPFKNTRIYLLEPSNEEFLISIGTIDKAEVELLTKLGASDMESFLAAPVSTEVS